MQAMYRRKHRRYASDAATLREANVIYMPLIWSADGRPHPQVGRAMQYAARMAGYADSDQTTGGRAAFLKRWRHEIAVALCRRRAAIARAVLPPPSTHLWDEEDAETQCPLEEDILYDSAEAAESDWDSSG